MSEPDSYPVKDYTGTLWIVSWRNTMRHATPSKAYTSYSRMVDAVRRHQENGNDPQVFEVNTATRIPLKNLDHQATTKSVLRDD